MGFACPICSERLEKLPAEAQRGGKSQGEIHISATPCGHIFHSYCIQKWLTGNMPSNKQCPCCRKDVPKLRCLALYPNQVDDSILDDSFSQFPSASGSGGGGSSGPAPSCDHGGVIASLKSQITRLEAELKDKGQLYDLLCSDHETLAQRFRQEKMESDMWMMRSKEFESYRDLAKDNERRMEKAEKQLKSYTHIDNVLKGVESSVSEDQRDFPPTKDSVQSLIQTKHILTRELKNLSSKLNELKSSYESIRSEKVKLKVQYDNQTRELKELKQVYEISRLNGRIRSTSPVAGPSCLSDSTPTGFRMKRRLQQSLLPSENTGSPGVDSDVDLFPIAVKAKKAKPETFQLDAKVKKIDTKTKLHKEKKLAFPDLPSPIPHVSSVSEKQHKKQKKHSSNLNETITLSDDSSNSAELLDLDEDIDDFKIRGNAPGAPPLMTSKKLKSLQEKSKFPVLGVTDSKKKMFKFTKR